MSLLPPVIAQFYADGKQYSAEVAKMTGQAEAFGKVNETAGQRVTNFANKASTAIIGVGVAFGAFAVDKAYKFESALAQIQNQTGASAGEIAKLKTEILDVSSATATSSADIASAFLQVEKAGLRGAKAYQLVRDAAKAAAITGTDVTSVTQTLIAAQTLGITKGMSLAKVTDLIVEANRKHIGSVNTLITTLSGRLGAALAASGMKLGQIAAISDIAAKAGYTQSRTMVTLATGLTKLENPTETSRKALLKFNINADALARDARKPGGLIQVLEDLRQQSLKTGLSFNTLVAGTFGSSAVGLVDILNNHLGTLVKTTTELNSSSGKKLNTAFDITQGQLEFKMKKLRTEFDNIMTSAGLLLLPDVTKVANWALGLTKFFKDHPLVSKIASDSAIGLFGAAVAYKIGKGLVGVVKGISGLFGAGETAAQTATLITPLDLIATNTGILVEQGGGRAASGLAGSAGAATVGGGSDVVASGGFKGFLTKFGVGAEALAAAAPALVVLAGQRGASAQDITAKINARFYNATFSSANFDAKSLDIPGFLGNRLPNTKRPGKVTIKHTTKVYARP